MSNSWWQDSILQGIHSKISSFGDLDRRKPSDGFKDLNESLIKVLTLGPSTKVLPPNFLALKSIPFRPRLLGRGLLLTNRNTFTKFVILVGHYMSFMYEGYDSPDLFSQQSLTRSLGDNVFRTYHTLCAVDDLLCVRPCNTLKSWRKIKRIISKKKVWSLPYNFLVVRISNKILIIMK